MNNISRSSPKASVLHRIYIRCPNDYVDDLGQSDAPCQAVGFEAASALARRVAVWLGTDPWSASAATVPTSAAEYRRSLIEREIDPADCIIEVVRRGTPEDVESGLTIIHGDVTVYIVKINHESDVTEELPEAVAA